jgi:ketosteroid isomerase-like protein
LNIEERELVYELYKKQKHNKEVVKQFYENLNRGQWEDIIKLFHEDFFIPVPDFINSEMLQLKNQDIEFAETFYNENHTRLTELGKLKNMSYIWPPTNKKELLDVMKLEAEYEKVSVKVFNIYAENDIVMVTRSYKITEIVSQVTTNRIVHDRFLMEDSKIRQTESFHDYLAILIQVGRIIHQEKNEIKVQNYLDNLKKLGIIQT